MHEQRPMDPLKAPRHPEAANAQQQGIRRTALVVGGIAVLIYAAFILSGVIGR